MIEWWERNDGSANPPWWLTKTHEYKLAKSPHQSPQQWSSGGNKAENLVFFLSFCKQKEGLESKGEREHFFFSQGRGGEGLESKGGPPPSISPTLVINGNIKFKGECHFYLNF
jgi:hypothetical protein